MGTVAKLYKAMWPQMTPAEVDAHELWQVAVLMARDEKLTLAQLPPPRPRKRKAVDSEPKRKPQLRRIDGGGATPRLRSGVGGDPG